MSQNHGRGSIGTHRGSSSFYKFAFSSNRGDGLVQLAHLQLFAGPRQLPVRAATNPRGRSPSGEEPQRVLTEATRGKWLDFEFASNGGSNLVLELATAGVVPDAYELWTANDFPQRDPTGWTVLRAENARGPWTETPRPCRGLTRGLSITCSKPDTEKKPGTLAERASGTSLARMQELGISTDLAEFALQHESHDMEMAIFFATSEEGMRAFGGAFLTPPTLDRMGSNEIAKRWRRPRSSLPEYARAAEAICVCADLMGSSAADGVQQMLEEAMLERPLEGSFDELAAELVMKAYRLASRAAARRYEASYAGVAEGNFFRGACAMQSALGWRGRQFHAALREMLRSSDVDTLQMVLALSKRGADECQARKVSSFHAILRLLQGGRPPLPGAVDAESPEQRLRWQAAEFLDDRKEKAFKSTFEEPTKMYFRAVGDSTMEGDVEVHGCNVYLAVLLATLGVKLPRDPHMSDEAKGMCAFLDANLGPALSELWRPENIGKPFAAIKGMQPSPTHLLGSHFIFSGSTPKAVANAAVRAADGAARQRVKLAPYLEQFALYFRQEFLFEPLLSNLMQNSQHDLQLSYGRMREQSPGAPLPEDYRAFLYDVEGGYSLRGANACALLQHVGIVRRPS